MSLSRLGEPLPRRIVVVRALRGLGDLLCIVPAMRALRAALPEADVTLLSLPWASTFVARFDRYFDGFIEFPGYPGIPERVPPIGELPAFLAGVQARQFDLALQMHGSGIASNPFTVMLGARTNAGFFLPGQYCPDPERFLAYPSGEAEVRRHLRLMEHLGLPLQGEQMEFPLREHDRAELADVLGESAAANRISRSAARRIEAGDYVCLHAGAFEPARRWPVERFAAVGDALTTRGLQVVLTGSAGEAELTAQVATCMRKPALDLAGRTSLGALAELLSRSRLLITNDTGVSHLAAALAVPSVVIFLASDPLRWAPVDRCLHRVVGGSAGVALAGDDGIEHFGPMPAAGAATTCGCHSTGGRPVEGQRCLRDGCVLQAEAGKLQRPLDVTPAMVLREAEALLGEYVHDA
jgi:ADP-heptose:LPS heptosyltransferase